LKLLKSSFKPLAEYIYSVLCSKKISLPKTTQKKFSKG